MVAKASAFRHFVATEYQSSDWASQQQDGARRRPIVTPARIFEIELHQPVVGLDSVLGVDQWGRTTPSHRVVGPPPDPRWPRSDRTILRALGAWELAPTRQASDALQRRWRDHGWAKRTLNSGRTVRLAVVDGSNFGGLWASVLGGGGSFYDSVDGERYAGRGHELTASRQLLERATAELAEGFATHLLSDGLMAARADFAHARRHWGRHLVVKTSEVETLSLLADPRALWSAASAAQLRQAGVEVVAATDAARSMTDTIHAQGGLHWEGLPFAWKLAWVQQTHRKGKAAGQTFEFWVLTTAESRSGQERRDLAHARWATENNGLKMTKAAVGSKKADLKDAVAKAALLLIWGIGLALRRGFRLWLETQRAWRNWTVKKTGKFLSRCLLSGVLDDEVLGCGGSP